MSDGFPSPSPTDPLDPAEEEEPVASPPADPTYDLSSHVEESLHSMSTQIQDLYRAQDDIKKMFLHQLILITRDHNKLMQHQIDFQKQLTEINRRCQILQDWMMSPFRLVPVQVLQDNTLNIDTIHSVISDQPSDDDSWSVQLLELLDHSIAAHFPHFEFPHWELLQPEIQQSPTEVLSENANLPTPEYQPPSPVQKVEDTQFPFTRQSTVEDEAIPSPLQTPTELEMLQNETQPVITVPEESPPWIPPSPENSPPNWMTVPSTEIENSELPT